MSTNGNGILELYENWKRLDAAAKAAKALADDARDDLLRKIPAGETRKGIQHQVIIRTITAWARVTNKLVELFVPSAKLSQYEEIVDENSSTSISSRPKDTR